jgi:hypothetical protein
MMTSDKLTGGFDVFPGVLQKIVAVDVGRICNAAGGEAMQPQRRRTQGMRMRQEIVVAMFRKFWEKKLKWWYSRI